MLRTLPILVSTVLCACPSAERGRAFQPRPVQRVEITGFSLSFEVPAAFSTTAIDGGVVYAGPAESAEYYTPLIVQPRATQAPLGEVLDGLMAPLMANPTFVMHRQAPIAVGGVLALLYELSFELHDAERRRLGVLVPTPGGVVDVALAANTDRFVDGVPIFDRMLDSLVVTEREPSD